MKSYRRRIPLAFGAGLIAALGLARAFEFAPQLVWNASASRPIGLYRLERRPPEVGDFVFVEADAALETFIAERGYLPPEIPLLKRVAALAGDEICRDETAILIDGLHVSDALIVDSINRKMPTWNGCFSLRDNEIFLLNAHEKSLDGRYFGPTRKTQVIGDGVPILTREPQR